MSIPESALNYGSILTLAGENAEINGKLNSKPINFTHIAIGDANDVYVQPSRTQTALVHELARIPITGMEKITPSKPDAVPQLKVWAKIPDDIVDIAVREFAAVATFDGTSYLHAVGNTVRIPILSGSNNGGEVNDIYIEMTFAVTSLDPIVMIDPTIVTATRKFVKDEDAKHLVAENPHPQYVKLSCLTGLIGQFHTAGQVPGWIDLKGGNLSRVTDKLLWEYALSSEMIIAQALKDADPVKYAMFFGDGDGSTSFTLPNHHLGHFTRGTPSAQTHGSTQNDALRNAYGSFSIDARKGIEPQGGFSFPGDSGLFVGGNLKSGSVITSSDYGGGLNYQSVHFDLSRVLPTSNEIRPFTANISIKIHRGWM
ncbi:TPA: phage tail protein [Vibrio cholerae]